MHLSLLIFSCFCSNLVTATILHLRGRLTPRQQTELDVKYSKTHLLWRRAPPQPGKPRLPTIGTTDSRNSDSERKSSRSPIRQRTPTGNRDGSRTRSQSPSRQRSSPPPSPRRHIMGQSSLAAPGAPTWEERYSGHISQPGLVGDHVGGGPRPSTAPGAIAEGNIKGQGSVMFSNHGSDPNRFISDPSIKQDSRPQFSVVQTGRHSRPKSGKVEGHSTAVSSVKTERPSSVGKAEASGKSQARAEIQTGPDGRGWIKGISDSDQQEEKHIGPNDSAEIILQATNPQDGQASVKAAVEGSGWVKTHASGPP